MLQLRWLHRSNGKQIWVNPPMNCEELLLKQAAEIKAVNPNTKVFVYRNLVKVCPRVTFRSESSPLGSR